MQNMGKVLPATNVEVWSFDLGDWSALPSKVEFKIENEHFADVGFRQAFKDMSIAPGYCDSEWVVKKYKKESLEAIAKTEQTTEGHTKKIVQMHLLVKYFADELAKKLLVLEKIKGFGQCFSYNNIHMWKIDDEYITLEVFTTGHFEKCMNNN